MFKSSRNLHIGVFKSCNIYFELALDDLADSSLHRVINFCNAESMLCVSHRKWFLNVFFGGVFSWRRLLCINVILHITKQIVMVKILIIWFLFIIFKMCRCANNVNSISFP